MPTFSTLPPELVHKVFKELMTYRLLPFQRQKSKVYTNQNKPHADGLVQVFEHPWAAARPLHNSLEHPKLRLPEWLYHNREEVRQSLCSWMATCRAWRDIAEPFSNSAYVTCVDGDMGVVPAGTRILQLYAEDDDDLDEEPPALEGLEHCLPAAHGALLTSLFLDTITLFYFEAIVAQLPHASDQIGALRIDFGEGGLLGYQHLAPESFYHTLSRCTSLRQLHVVSQNVLATSLVQAFQHLPNISELSIRSAPGPAPQLKPGYLASSALRHFEVDGIADISLSTLLVVAEDSAASLEFLVLRQLHEMPLPLATAGASAHPPFPRLAYLSVSGAYRPGRVCPPWTDIAELVSILDKSPRLEQLSMWFLNWDEPAQAEPASTSNTPTPPRPSPTKRFLDKISNGVVRTAHAFGKVPLELKEVIENPPKEWEEGVLQMLSYWE